MQCVDRRFCLPLSLNRILHGLGDSLTSMAEVCRERSVITFEPDDCVVIFAASFQRCRQSMASKGMAGRNTSKQAPALGLEWHRMSPPCCSIIPLDVASPKAVPSPNVFDVKNGSKMLACRAAGIPWPVSCTRILTKSAASFHNAESTDTGDSFNSAAHTLAVLNVCHSSMLFDSCEVTG